MSTIGQSQAFNDFRNLVTESKKASNNEAANVINPEEATAIKNKLVETVKNGNMTEGQAKAFMQEAEAFMKSEFVGSTNISKVSVGITDGCMSLDLGTDFNIELEGKIDNPVDKPKIEANAKVTDYENKASKDASEGKDQQYQVLSKNKLNYIPYDPQTGKVTNIQTQNGKVPFEGNMKDIITNDFKKYAQPSLSESFPNNEKGVTDFKSALEKLPGVKSPVKENDVKELLSYIHTGAGSEGNVNVKKLQVLLENLTGDMGTKIREKNTSTGGDDHYGYATTLQVRSLAGAVNEQKPEIKSTPFSATGEVSVKDTQTKGIKTWMMVGDSSGSMQSKLDVFGKLFANKEIFEPNAKFNIGASQDFNLDTRIIGTNLDNSQAAKALSKEEGNFKSTGASMRESGFTMAVDMLKAQKEPVKNQPAAIMVISDANEQNANKLRELVDLAKQKGYSQLNIAALQGESGYTQNTMITIDLKDNKQVNALLAKVDQNAGVNQSNSNLERYKGMTLDKETGLAKNLLIKQSLFAEKGKPLGNKDQKALDEVIQHLEQGGRKEGINKIKTEVSDYISNLNKVPKYAETKKNAALETIDDKIDASKQQVSFYQGLVETRATNVENSLKKEGVGLNWQAILPDLESEGAKATNFNY